MSWQLAVLQARLLSEFLSLQRSRLQARVLRSWAFTAAVSAAAARAASEDKQSHCGSPVALGAVHAAALGKYTELQSSSLTPSPLQPSKVKSHTWMGPREHTPVLSSAALQAPVDAEPALLHIECMRSLVQCDAVHPSSQCSYSDTIADMGGTASAPDSAGCDSGEASVCSLAVVAGHRCGHGATAAQCMPAGTDDSRANERF